MEMNITEEQLNVSDIARLAMLNEEKGARFYKSMTERADSQKAKDVFHKLAKEETEHCRFFASLAKQSDKNEKIEQKSAAYLLLHHILIHELLKHSDHCFLSNISCHN